MQKNLPTKDKVTGGVQRLIRFLDKIVLKRDIIHPGSCIQKRFSSRKMEGRVVMVSSDTIFVLYKLDSS